MIRTHVDVKKKLGLLEALSDIQVRLPFESILYALYDKNCTMRGTFRKKIPRQNL